ncbi:regulatory protein RecX [Calditerrivibrio nitroreducens]|uniref:Regulatory protein RecX n=1 Tax=Calditerrivibrio nitroreducens (strain DSM 19672 / NBRC 101217 / Yu37-1) TaxID=768670 RepID=E4TIR2_CALNY|nr:RecX family transcriptional regulator [Calditerrivibrio nitroreducens]ADR18017.1 regulatory protein RecX [Calditerrivibrio nitroreducens DSM 19672]
MIDDILKYALRLLSKKDYFESEIRNKLVKKFEDNDGVEEVIKKLKDLKYIDDNRVSEQFIKSQLRKGYGQYLIKKKLMEKGVVISISEIGAYLSEEEDLKRKIAEKLHKYHNDYEKTVAYFYRKGYPYSLIKRLISEVIEDEGYIS